MHTEFYLEFVKRRDAQKAIQKDDIKTGLKKLGVRVWTVFIWLRTDSWWAIVNNVIYCHVQKGQRMSRLFHW